VELGRRRTWAGLACIRGAVTDARRGVGRAPGSPQRAVRVSHSPFFFVSLSGCADVTVCGSDKDNWEMSIEDLDARDATLQVCTRRRRGHHVCAQSPRGHYLKHPHPNWRLGDARGEAPA
jgi:hypothetical protein